MSLADLIYPKRNRGVATATPATVKGGNGPSVATVATVAVAKSRNLEAANDPTTAPTIPDDCIGALQSADGGLYLPWGPCLSADDVRRMRGELVALIEELADLEQWDSGRRDDVLTRAIRGPLSDLQPNMHHFHERLTEARAEKEARALSESRSFRVTDAVLRARGYL